MRRNLAKPALRAASIAAHGRSGWTAGAETTTTTPTGYRVRREAAAPERSTDFLPFCVL